MTPEADRPRRRVPANAPSTRPGRLDTAARLASRHQAASRRRTIRRRRAGVLLAALVVVAAIVAACNAVTSASSKGTKTSTTGGRGGTTRPQTTTTTLPASFNVGIHTFDWDERGPGITHVGPTGAALPGRVLTTEVRYPTLAGSAGTEAVNARPSTVGGPYPVIVFAHGFETEPLDYAGLLDSWVRAGFVVVSPIFPDENLQTVTADGGIADPTIASTLENDVYGEPGDIVYVLKQLQAVANQPWGENLKGVLNLADIGLAGQSDGANVVAALSFASGLRSLGAGLPSAPKAVAVLSGSAWSYLPDGRLGTYGGSSSSPALLQVQSDADGCNTPTDGTDLFASLQADLRVKWFVTLLGADHLGPYEGVSPWAGVVDAVTTRFFENELNWRPASTPDASIVAAGTLSGVAQITTTVNESTVPQVELIPGC